MTTGGQRRRSPGRFTGCLPVQGDRNGGTGGAGLREIIANHPDRIAEFDDEWIAALSLGARWALR